jgi:hypothetical protein
VADDVRKTAASDAPGPAPKTSAALPARPESRADRARRLVYRGRFAAFYFVLAVIAGAGIGALVVLVGRGSPAPAPPWSEWQPTGSGERRAAQIADRVSDPYRLPSGNALAPVVYAGPPTSVLNDGTPIQLQALAVETELQSRGEDIDVLPGRSNVMYNLCGRGVACTIDEGEDSIDRRRLIRREALELALYSFKYIDGIDSVLAMLPPRVLVRPGATEPQVLQAALFLRRSDVADELDAPLSEVLTAPLTPGVGEISDEETRIIDRLTRARVYEYQPVQQQNGSWLMSLEPVPAP